MPYEFSGGETEGRAIQRCAVEQLDTAIEQLSEGVKRDPVTAVHEARKALKKERSLLRLGRGALRASRRRRLNSALRDAGRRLSAARDAEVMIEAVDELAKHYSGRLPKKAFETIKAHLDEQAGSARTSLIDSGLTAEVVEALKSLRLEVEHMPLRRDGWQAIDDGLLRSYQEGRRAYRRARSKPTVENLHEWRKRGKDLWYHLRLLRPISPGIMHGHVQEAHHLSDLLGDDHDLAVLRAALAGGAAIPVDLDSVVALIDQRREQLEAEAMLIGARLYAESPKAFLRRLHRYWKVWRSETAREDLRRPDEHAAPRPAAASVVV
jgi:CHAD domain-containing protein